MNFYKMAFSSSATSSLHASSPPMQLCVASPAHGVKLMEYYLQAVSKRSIWTRSSFTLCEPLDENASQNSSVWPPSVTAKAILSVIIGAGGIGQQFFCGGGIVSCPIDEAAHYLMAGSLAMMHLEPGNDFVCLTVPLTSCPTFLLVR